MRKCYGNSAVTLISINTNAKDEKIDKWMEEQWLRYENSFNSEENKDQASLGLSSSLAAVKARDRGNPIDGIYSILGLLPYGEKVPVSYKSKICPECSEQKENKDCKHEAKNKKRPIYTKDEMEKTLLEIDEKGSSNVVGAMDVNHKLGNIKLNENGVKLIGSQHKIIHPNLFNMGEKSSLKADGGYANQFLVNTASGGSFFLQGAGEILEKAKDGDILVVVNSSSKRGENFLASNGFAILVPSESNFDCPISILKLVSLPREGTKIIAEFKIGKHTRETEERVKILLRMQSQLLRLSAKNKKDESGCLIKKQLEKVKGELSKYIINFEKICEDEKERIKAKIELKRIEGENENNWKNIHRDFKDSLTPNDVEFAIYLEGQGKTPEWCLNCDDMDKLREEYINKRKMKENINESENSISITNIVSQFGEEIESQLLKPVLLKPSKISSQPLTEQNQTSAIQLQEEKSETFTQIETSND
nr:11751_t:CDS:2 [Entrophospora candida]